MSQQAPLLRIGRSDDGWSVALNALQTFPLIEATWDEALQALARVQPAAVLVTDNEADAATVAAFASAIDALAPYVPLIAVNPTPGQWASNLIPFAAPNGLARLDARLTAALRVRTLHAAVLRRHAGADALPALPDSDPLADASVLLLGRGASYPALSIALGERVGVIGALSIEIAAKHLNSRDLDGIVVGDGFSPRVVEAFLTVLADDPRFRDLPVVLTGSAAAFASSAQLANLELASGPAAEMAAQSLGLFRQHALAARLGRALQSLEAGGLLDPRTGLLQPEVFERDFAAAATDAQQRGASLSAARFAFDGAANRMLFDAARILSRLKRQADFACMQSDGSLLVAFTETELRTAHMIARRLASVMRHTLHGLGRDKGVEPHVTIVTLLPKDSAATMRARLEGDSRPQRQAAS